MISENTPKLWRKDFPLPRPDGHKYHRGHAVVLSGGPANTGAARLAAQAALRAGAGLVTLFCPPAAVLVNAAHLTAIMLRSIEDNSALATALGDDRITAVVLGPALGVGAKTCAKVEAVLAANRPAVLDADALTSFAGEPERLLALNCVELRVMAEARSARGTSDGTNACQAGIIKPLKIPVSAVKPRISHGFRHPIAQVSHSRPAAKAIAAWVPMRRVRRSRRSASEPPSGPSTNAGMNWAKPARPTKIERFVSSNSTKGTARFWIQLPEFDASAPPKNNR